MKPFAYQLTVHSCGEIEADYVVATAKDLADKLRAFPAADIARRGHFALYAHHAGGQHQFDPSVFAAKVELDMDVLRAEVRAAMRVDRQKQGEWLKTLTHTVTGSPWLCDFSEAEVLESWVKEREWRWKTDDEIDWSALEGVS